MPRHPSERDLQRLTLGQVARAIGRPQWQTRKLLLRLQFIPQTHRKHGRYDRSLVKILTTLLEANTPTESSTTDWLATFLEGDPHA